MTTENLDLNTAMDAVRAALRTELELGDTLIDPDDELGLLPNSDSVRLMRCVTALERQFDMEMDDMAIRSAQTVADLARLVRNGLEAG